MNILWEIPPRLPVYDGSLDKYVYDRVLDWFVVYCNYTLFVSISYGKGCKKLPMFLFLISGAREAVLCPGGNAGAGAGSQVQDGSTRHQPHPAGPVCGHGCRRQDERLWPHGGWHRGWDGHGESGNTHQDLSRYVLKKFENCYACCRCYNTW